MKKHSFTKVNLQDYLFILILGASNSRHAETSPCTVNSLIDQGEATLTLLEALEAQCTDIVIDDSLAGQSIEVGPDWFWEWRGDSITGPKENKVTIIRTSTHVLFNDQEITVNNLIFDGNESPTGLLSNNFSTEFVLNNVLVTGYVGQVIDIVNTGYFEINNSQFVNNKHTLFKMEEGGGYITDSLFENNHEPDGYGPITMDGNLVVSNSIFRNNSAKLGCGVMTGPQSLYNVAFENNHTDGNGGALCGASFDRYGGSIIFKNNSAGGKGGAIYNASSESAPDSRILFDGNSAGIAGGAIYNSNTWERDILFIHFVNNYVTGDCIPENCDDPSLGQGGAVFIDSSTSHYYKNNSTSIQNSIFTNNSASNKGGAVAFSNNSDTTSNLTIEKSTFHNNSTALKGGAIYITDSPNSAAKVKIENATIYNNIATKGSGAIYFNGEHIESNLNLNHSTLIDHTNPSEGGSVIEVSQNSNSEINISHSVLSENTGGDGSICNLSESSSINIEYSFIDDATMSTNCQPLILGDGNMLGSSDSKILDAKLNPPSDTGGSFFTFYPKDDSPLIDAGNPLLSEPPSQDQRGYDRIMQDAIDIGAVEFGNYSPQVVREIEDLVVKAGERVIIYTATRFSAPPENRVTYSVNGLPDGIRYNYTGKIDGYANELGSFEIEVIASDDSRNTTSVYFNLHVTNEPPTAETIETINIVAGIPFEINLGAYFSDEEGDTIHYSIKNLPDSFTMNETTGLLTGVANEVVDYNFNIIAKDDWSESSTSVSIIVNNTPPSFQSLQGMTFEVGEQIHWDIAGLFSDEDGHPLTFKIEGVPDWLNIDNGVVKGFAGEAFADESYTIRITVTDSFITLITTVKLLIIPESTKDEDKDSDNKLDAIGSLFYILAIVFICILKRRYPIKTDIFLSQ